MTSPKRELWRSLLHHLRATPTLARISFADLVAYRAEMVIWILTSTLPLVMLGLWNTVVAGAPIRGFDQPSMARYFAATLIVRQLTGAWLIWEMSWEIRTGAMSPKLLRPIHPLWTSAWNMAAALPFRMLILAPLIGGIIAWRPDLWRTPTEFEFAAFCVSVGLAWCLAFLVQAAFATLAFWFDQAVGIFGIWFGLYGVFSGYVAPLAMFPEKWSGILRWLPFRALLAIPVEIVGGWADTTTIWEGLAIQAFWTALFAVLTAILWTRGVRRYGAYGA